MIPMTSWLCNYIFSQIAGAPAVIRAGNLHFVIFMKTGNSAPEKLLALPFYPPVFSKVGDGHGATVWLMTYISPFLVSTTALSTAFLALVDSLNGRLLVTVFKAKLAAFKALVAESGNCIRIRFCLSSMIALTEQRTLETTHSPTVINTIVKLTANVFAWFVDLSSPSLTT